MSTTIDSLQIEIQSNSTNAATGIDNLAKALKKLNKNGDIQNAVNSLNDLRKSLHAFVNMPSNASKIESLANSLTKLKKVGKINIGASLTSVKTAMESLGAINIDGVAPQIERISGALAPLNNVKGSGFNSAMNGLKKLDEVSENLESGSIDRFVEKIKELDEKLTPVSKKLVAIGHAFKGVNTTSIAAGKGVGTFRTQINATAMNLTNFANVARDIRDVLQPVIHLISTAITKAIEWEGIAARFSRGFGDQADEVYAKVHQLNEGMGLNSQQFMQYSSVYATMLQGYGVAAEDAQKMALGYTELTYDIWAGYNDIYKSFDDAAVAVRAAIAGETEPVQKAGFDVRDTALEQAAALEKLEYSTQNTTNTQKTYLRYQAMVNQAMNQNLVGVYADELDTAEGMMRTFNQQMETLSQTFGSVFLPVLVKVMPWLTAFVELLGEAIRAVASVFGVEIQKFEPEDFNGLGNIAGDADDATGSINDTTKALKDLKNATLGIDELNVINPQSSSGSGSGSGSGVAGSWDRFDVDSVWDESIYNKINEQVDDIKNMLKEALDGITAVISGFALAIGTILVVSGANIPVGLALMALGAVGLVAVIAENWNKMSDKLAKVLTTVTSVLGGFLLAIGAFLAFSGVNVPLGIGLMAAGAVSLATAVTINWKFLEGDMKNTLSILTGIISGGLLAMGALFAFTGAGVGLGISLMLAGAVGLATTATLNWDSMPKALKNVIADITTIVSNAAIAVGAMLAFSGANVPIGMALMAAGAAGLVAAKQLKWDSTSEKVKSTVDTIVQFVSSAALGVGAVLAFSGVNIPLGVALMAAGAVGLTSSTTVNWKSITNTIKNVLKEIGIAAGASLLALGVILCLSGVGIPIGIALIAAGAAGLASGVALNWDGLLNKLKETWKKIEKWWDELKLKAVDILVNLKKNGWKTIKEWIGKIPGVSQAVSLAKSGWSSVKSWIGSSPTINAGVKLVKSGWTTIKNWLGNLNFNLGFKLPKIGINWGTKKVLGFQISYPSSFYTYAKGGFPDMGEMFIAREAGPEMVGKIGNKTTVANNEQIVEGISEGVYAAVLAAMRASQTDGSQSVNVYLDGRQITSSVEKRQRERGTSFVGRQAYSY